MKRILQAMDGVATKPVAGANDMAKFLRVVKEANVEYLPVDPETSAQLRAQSQASMDADGPKHQADSFIRFSSGMYDQNTLPKTMVIKPGVTLPVKFNPIKNMNGDVLANAIAANKLLPPDLQFSSAELSQIVGQDRTQEDISFNGVTQHDNGDMSYQAGPLSMRKNKDGSSDTTATIGDTTARVQQNPIGVKTLTAQGPAADAINSTDASAQRKDVDPAKFAAFQKQLPANEGISKFLSIVKQNDVSILNEGANPHKVSLPVQMAMQHYQQEKTTHKPVGRDSVIRKYFKEVEEELTAEKTNKRQLINQYASVIAERVLMKEGMFDNKPQVDWNKRAKELFAKNLNEQQVKAQLLKEGCPPKQVDVYVQAGQMEESLDEACWDKYKQVGMKKKGRKMVPNCVPKENVAENEIPGHSMGFTGGVGPGMIDAFVDEMSIEFDKNNPLQSKLNHKSNPGTIEYRIMRARSQIKDLATRVDSNELIVWESIARQFPELAMNIEEIRHGIEELAKIRKGGGRRSHNIDKHIGEAVMPAIKATTPTTPKTVKPKAKTSVCRAGQTQTGTQIKNGISVPKCSVTSVKKKVTEDDTPEPGQGAQSSLLRKPEPPQDVFNSKENIISGIPYTLTDLAIDLGIIGVSAIAGAVGGPAGEAAALAANASRLKRLASLIRAGINKLGLMGGYERTGSVVKYIKDVVKSLPANILLTATGSIIFNTMIGVLEKAGENDYPGLTGTQAARNMRNVVRYSDTQGNPSPVLHPERYK